MRMRMRTVALGMGTGTQGTGMALGQRVPCVWLLKASFQSRWIIAALPPGAERMSRATAPNYCSAAGERERKEEKKSTIIGASATAPHTAAISRHSPSPNA